MKTQNQKTNDRGDVYEIVTEQIIKLLEAGTVPWHKPWNGGGMPINLVSKKEYRGINVWMLGAAGYGSPYWVSYKQATDLGGNPLPRDIQPREPSELKREHKNMKNDQTPKTNSPGRPTIPEGERATSQLQFRVTRQRKAAYVRAANRKEQTLASWAFAALDQEAGYTPDHSEQAINQERAKKGKE